jgi:phage terminase large subunit GpA-like protein
MHCEKYFVPRFEQMRWPENATPAEAAKAAQLQCPHCGGLHQDDDKTEMNARGLVDHGFGANFIANVIAAMPEGQARERAVVWSEETVAMPHSG